MKGDWPDVTKTRPCPICGKPDRCQRTQGGASRCFREVEAPVGWRVVSTCADGTKVFRPSDDASHPSRGNGKDWGGLARKYVEKCRDERLAELAGQLHVTAESLRRIGCGWTGSSWSFPEHDGQGNVIGLVTRSRSGAKKSRPGGKRGLTVPDGWQDADGPVLIVEGQSDVAACLTLGLAAVGRPSNRGGVEHLAQLLEKRVVIVVGEHDRRIKDGVDLWPGRDGAEAVARRLSAAWGRGVSWVMPPEGLKDIRELLQARCDDLDDAPKCHAAGTALLATLREQCSVIEHNVGDAVPDDCGYRIAGGGLVWEKSTKDGPVDVVLTNFTARIVAEVVHDDGVDQLRHFELEADLGGRPHAVSVTAEDFASLSWVAPQLGARAIVFPGYGARDHARTAMQLLSRDIESRTVFTHTGWRRIDGDWAFLHAGGGLGVNGAVPGLEVALPSDLERLTLPAPVTDDALREAVAEWRRLLELAPAALMVPLLAAVVRSIIGGSDFAIHIASATGCGKTEIATLVQQHFGPAITSKSLLASWSSTANALEAVAFTLKDVLLTVDDLAPDGTPAEVQRLLSQAARLIRAQGNRAGRRRMRADTTLRSPKPPRGLILSTGEMPLQGHSVRARVLNLEMCEGDLDWPLLSKCQAAAAAGSYATVVASLICWMAARRDEVTQYLEEQIRLDRASRKRVVGHRRTPDITAALRAAWKVLMRFFEETAALPTSEIEQLQAVGEQAIAEAEAGQAAHLDSAYPVDRFVELLGSAIASGSAHVAGVDGDAPANPTRWGWRPRGATDPDLRPQGERVGWVEAENLFLNGEAAFRVVQSLAVASGQPIGLGCDTFWQRVKERGLLVTCDPERTSTRRVIAGGRPRVRHVQAGLVCENAGQSGHSDHGAAQLGEERGSVARGMARGDHVSGPLIGPSNGVGAAGSAHSGPSGPHGPSGPLHGAEDQEVDEVIV